MSIGINNATPVRKIQTWFLCQGSIGFSTGLGRCIPDFYQYVDLYLFPCPSFTQPGVRTKISFPSALMVSLSTPLPENPSLQVQLYPPIIRFFIRIVCQSWPWQSMTVRESRTETVQNGPTADKKIMKNMER